jgi:hypothetical protein
VKVTLAVVCAAVLGVTACGGSSKPDPAPLKAAVTDYSSAYLGGHGDAAFALMSARCQAATPKAQMDSLASAAQSLYGALPIKTLTVDSQAASDASVSYTYAVSKLDQTHQHWVKESGAWKYDGC